MKMYEKLLAIIVGLSMIASCVKITEVQNGTFPKNNNGEYPILFSNHTKAQTTSVSGTGYDEFKLFVWNSLNDTIMNPYTVSAAGVNDYHYENVPGQKLQYFKDASSWYDFIGVVPGDHDMTLENGVLTVENVKSFVVDDKLSEKAINVPDTLRWSAGLAADSPEELLTAYKRVPKSKYGSVVNLPFKHENAVIFLGFSSNRTDTELTDYAPSVPATSVPGTTTTEHAKMFDLLAQGKLVGYALTKFQGDEHGEYRGFTGNYFNINPYLTGNSYITQERLAELMPLVNAQFIYTDENCNLVDKWEYGVDKKDKMFLKFADGVDATEFIAGNDAFWANLTDTEKTALKNHHDSGCRIIRIERLDDGKYFAWGESYGLIVDSTTRDFKVIDGGTIGHAALPAIEGVRVFSADSLGVNNIPADTLYCVHIPHTIVADATIDANGCSLSYRTTTDKVIQYSLPATTTLGETAIWSPTTFYALPGDTNLRYIVVKLSFVYNGEAVYDVRVPIKFPDAGLEAGKYYRYELYITSKGNGTDDPNEARDEKDEIVIENNPVINVRLVEVGYAKGDSKKLTI